MMKWSEKEMFFYVNFFSRSSAAKWMRKRERYESRIAHTTYYTGKFFFCWFHLSNSYSSIVLCGSHIQHEKRAICSKHTTQLTTTKSDYRYTHMLQTKWKKDPKQITVLMPAQTVCSFALTRTERFSFSSFFCSLAQFARSTIRRRAKKIPIKLKNPPVCGKKRAIFIRFSSFFFFCHGAH